MRQLGDAEQPDPPAWERLGDVLVPSVAVLGDREYPMVSDCSRGIAGRIPGCRLVDAPGADHMLPLRVPGLLVDLITAQLSERQG